MSGLFLLLLHNGLIIRIRSYSVNLGNETYFLMQLFNVRIAQWRNTLDNGFQSSITVIVI